MCLFCSKGLHTVYCSWVYFLKLVTPSVMLLHLHVHLRSVSFRPPIMTLCLSARAAVLRWPAQHVPAAIYGAANASTALIRERTEEGPAAADPHDDS